MSKKEPEQTYRRPHAEAVAAMWLHSGVYANSRLSAMDFYDQLSEGEKSRCRDIVRDIVSAPGGREP